MKMKDIEIRIKELEDELKELREEAEMRKEQRESKPWKPKCREQYYFIKNGFYVGCCRSQNNRTDKRNFEIGNCFPTRERAEKVVKKMQTLLQLEELHDMLCPGYEPDWEDENGYTLCLRRDYINNRWMEYNWGGDEVFPVYFNSVANVHKAAKILNRELELELDEK